MARFGLDSVFKDVGSISAGQDFEVAIRKQINSVAAVLVIIGPDWLSGVANDEFGRLEVSTALASDIPVIPVLHDGATMPSVEELPDGLRALARRQAIAVSSDRWDRDVDQLTELLGAFVASPTRPDETRQGWWAGSSSGSPAPDAVSFVTDLGRLDRRVAATRTHQFSAIRPQALRALRRQIRSGQRRDRPRRTRRCRAAAPSRLAWETGDQPGRPSSPYAPTAPVLSDGAAIRLLHDTPCPTGVSMTECSHEEIFR